MVLLAPLLLSSLAWSQQPKVHILSPQELLGGPGKYIILDARPLKKFRAGHIPGSHPMAWDEWTLEKPNFLNSLLGHPENWGRVSTKADAIQKRLRKLGISNHSRVVVVGDPEDWGEEGRIAWNLLYWGLSEVSLLDGGFPAWKSAGGKPSTKETPLKGNGSFTVSLQEQRRANSENLQSAIQEKTPYFDLRSEEEYKGKTYTGMPRGGHVPGAKHLSWKSLYDKDGHFVSGNFLRAHLQEPDAQPIAYCVGGVRSALFAVLIEARLGTIVKNYDGSMWEWSRNPQLPMVLPSPP